MKSRQSVLAVLALIALVTVIAGGVWAEEPQKININTASVEELTKLKKIGVAYAARIVDYREKNGPFQKPEDITLVQGIGSKTYELNKDCICIE
jgi:competence protein ComEA